MGGGNVCCKLMIKSKSFSGLMSLGYDLHETFLAFYFFLGHVRKLEQLLLEKYTSSGSDKALVKSFFLERKSLL